jgi:hypothetical protein
MVLLMGQISGIIFILGLDALKAPGTGSMTLPLLGLVVMLVVCLIFGIQLKEAPVRQK